MYVIRLTSHRRLADTYIYISVTGDLPYYPTAGTSSFKEKMIVIASCAMAVLIIILLIAAVHAITCKHRQRNQPRSRESANKCI